MSEPVDVPRLEFLIGDLCGATSLAEYQGIAETQHRDFCQALRDAVMREPLLFATIPSRDSGDLCWLEWGGLDGRIGYWVACSVEHREDWPAEGQRTFLTVSYCAEDDEGETVADVYLSGRSSRSGPLLAAMAIEAVRQHRYSLKED